MVGDIINNMNYQPSELSVNNIVSKATNCFKHENPNIKPMNNFFLIVSLLKFFFGYF